MLIQLHYILVNVALWRDSLQLDMVSSPSSRSHLARVVVHSQIQPDIRCQKCRTTGDLSRPFVIDTRVHRLIDLFLFLFAVLLSYHRPVLLQVGCLTLERSQLDRQHVAINRFEFGFLDWFRGWRCSHCVIKRCIRALIVRVIDTLRKLLVRTCIRRQVMASALCLAAVICHWTVTVVLIWRVFVLSKLVIVCSLQDSQDSSLSACISLERLMVLHSRSRVILTPPRRLSQNLLATRQPHQWSPSHWWLL